MGLGQLSHLLIKFESRVKLAITSLIERILLSSSHLAWSSNLAKSLVSLLRKASAFGGYVDIFQASLCLRCTAGPKIEENYFCICSWLKFLGQINREPLQDVVFADAIRPRAGAFSSLKEFHDWFSFLFKRLAASGSHWEGYELKDIPDPYRQLLQDDPGVVFTHADLHQSNIMVSEGGPCRVVAIIDWHQSGWYPDYWEFYKAEYTNHWESEWV
ncbi:hypothetical protein FOXG_16872 [Fusarium oxysporum f. sp. lycopersici 4287]|uniref:Aminoglycoside phosphotransferase domain-containing protein n=2 Tax=Fusarium oxysporum TaxID=5507 RepID=A0A0J9W9U8_FUSO4|nr:hypothetical protein FOXG_16872 [Fusarium oxysporum f. sp. lycopersici 4287]KNB19638.1 hypothetical protein FOXG_16872 [Fusarium oxysporum f. sp. lycopersici 4287]